MKIKHERLMAIKTNIILYILVLLVIASSVKAAAGYLAFPFKTQQNGVMFIETKSPDSEFTVRAYYSEKADASKTLWCEYESKKYGNGVFYIEHNAQDNAALKWVADDGIEINGLALRLPMSYYLWERDDQVD